MDQVQFPITLAQPATESHCFTQTLAQFHSRFHNLAVQILLLLWLKWLFEAFSLPVSSCVHCGHALYKDASDWAQTQACVCELDGTSSLPSAKWDCVSALTSLPCLPAAVVHCPLYPFRPDAASRSCSRSCTRTRTRSRTRSRAVCGSCRVLSPWYSEPFPFRHSPVLLLQLFLNFAQVSSLGFLLFTSHSAGSPPTHTLLQLALHLLHLQKKPSHWFPAVCPPLSPFPFCPPLFVLPSPWAPPLLSVVLSYPPKTFFLRDVLCRFKVSVWLVPYIYLNLCCTLFHFYQSLIGESFAFSLYYMW